MTHVGRTIFCSFLDYFHYDYAVRVQRYRELLVEQEARLALRICVLIAQQVTISASAIIESPLTPRIVSELDELSGVGDLVIIGNDESMGAHFERRARDHFDVGSPVDITNAYRRRRTLDTSYERRDILLSNQIRKTWAARLETDALPAWYVDDMRRKGFKPAQIEAIWVGVPDRVYPRALVPPHLVNEFQRLGVSHPSYTGVGAIVDAAYTAAHSAKPAGALLTGLRYLNLGYEAPELGRFEIIRYPDAVRFLHATGLRDKVLNASGSALAAVKYSALGETLAANLTGASVPPEGVDSDWTQQLSGMLDQEATGPTGTVFEHDSPTVGVITALPIESLAVTLALGCRRIGYMNGDPNRYSFAEVPVEDGAQTVKVIVAHMPRQSNNQASSVATNLFRTFSTVRDVIFCGIACGIPNPHKADSDVRLGDILVSDRRGIVQTDAVAIKDGENEDRSILPPPSRRLLNAVRDLEVDILADTRRLLERIGIIVGANEHLTMPSRDTDILLDGEGTRVPVRNIEGGVDRPRVFYGAIGSSNALIRDHKLRDELGKRFSLIGLEMEGAGTAEAGWSDSRGYLVIRGVSDYGDNRTKNDLWHGYAAAAASGYLRELIARVST